MSGLAKGKMMKHLSRTAYVFMLWSILSPLTAGADGRFEKFDLKLRGNVTEVINEDLDGDGLLDVLAVNIDRSAEPPARRLAVYHQDREKGFSDSRRIEWDVPKDVAALDVGDVAPAPGLELVFITENGVSFASVSGGRVGRRTELLQVQSVVAIASKRWLPYYNFVWDYTGDGRDDILVCGFHDSLFMKQTDGYAFSEQRINIRPDIDIFAFDISALMISPEHPMFRVSYQAPQLYSHDYNADGRPDLIAAFRDEVMIFAQDESGFSREPSAHYRIELFEEEEDQFRGPPPAIDFEDIDADGRVDVVVHHMKGRIGNMKSRSVLFWGKSKNIEKGEPDLEFETEHTVMAKIIVWDVNGDGRFDLVMPTYNISAWNLGMILFTGTITVEWAYFIQKEDKTFNKIPDRVITTDMKFNLRKFRLESGVPNVVADFNGDGFPDQAMGESEEVLVITLRDAEGNPLEPIEKVEVPVAMFFRAADLNKDGLSDIIMYYLEKEEYQKELRVLLNKGDWTPEQ
jgi:hypothetical protein